MKFRFRKHISILFKLINNLNFDDFPLPRHRPKPDFLTLKISLFELPRLFQIRLARQRLVRRLDGHFDGLAVSLHDVRLVKFFEQRIVLAFQAEHLPVRLF